MVRLFTKRQKKDNMNSNETIEQIFNKKEIDEIFSIVMRSNIFNNKNSEKKLESKQ